MYVCMYVCMYARCTGISIQRNLLRQMQFAVALAHAFAFIHANVKCVLLACQLFTSISLQSNVLCLNTSVKLSSISALSSHDITLQYTHYRTCITVHHIHYIHIYIHTLHYIRTYNTHTYITHIHTYITYLHTHTQHTLTCIT